MLSAVLNNKLATPNDVCVSDIKPERRQYLAEKYRVSVTESNKEAVGKGEVVVLAIKPQNLADIMADIKGSFRLGQLVISIIAGSRIDTLRQGLSHKAIVRVMPNTPAQIGEGMSVWTATPDVTAAQKQTAAAILGSMGKEIFVDDEKYLDMVTAVSGSGPAYFFFFVEALVEAAVQIGLSRDVAGKLALQTFVGSAQLLKKSGKSPTELRKQVTSPGGTTAAAIARFEESGFHKLVLDAVVAAYNRAKELGK
jgi:pyrroline-5-carboxylate reductase